MDIGPGELIIVLAVLLLLFGGKKLPEIARGLGQAQREFRRGLHPDPEVEPTAGSTLSSLEPAGPESPGSRATTTGPDRESKESSATRDAERCDIGTSG